MLFATTKAVQFLYTYCGDALGMLKTDYKAISKRRFKPENRLRLTKL